MRARNLKPKFFKNEILGSADPLYSLLFEGLWCEADREGRLEDRPLRLCVEIFPYRRDVTPDKLDKMLDWLDRHDFIRRYQVGGARYIQVLQFGKHQRPHSKEKPSEIPPFNAKQHQPRKGRAPTKVAPSTDLGDGEHALTPDSGLLTPDSGLLTPDSPNPRSAKEGKALPVVRQLPRGLRAAATAGLSRNGSHKAREPEPESEKAKRALQLLQSDPTLGEGDAARLCHTTVDAIRALKA